jgi:plastocyanin domain-containing protein
VTAADLTVLGAGIVAIGGIYWWFFAVRGGAVEAAAVEGGVQEQVITVAGGYSPATVRVQAGRPVRLIFDRQESNPCTEEVVLSDFGVRRFLPTGERTAVEFTPGAAGTFRFSCGMGMVHGELIVRGDQ